MTVSWKLKLILNVSVNSNWVHPRGLAQKPCPGGSGFDFWKLPGAGNSTRAGILWKMNVKLQKIAWIKFLLVKTKNKQAEFLTFFKVYVFSQWNFFWSMDQFFGSAVTHTLQKILGVKYPTIAKKVGNTTLLISSSNYINYINVWRFVFPVFRNFSEAPCYEGWIWCKEFPRLMNKGRFHAGGRFHLLFSS